MVQTIAWTHEANRTFSQICTYLHETWSEKEVWRFTDLVSEKLALLERYPRLGSITKRRDIRKTVVHKNVILVYKYFPRKKKISLLKFWDTRQNPSKM